MVVFVHTKPSHTHQKHKLYSKLDHLLHHQKSPKSNPGPDHDLLRAFRSGISDALNKLTNIPLLKNDSSNSTMMISFPWLNRGFNLLRTTNASLVNLIEHDLGHPMSEWAAGPLTDGYFSYTLELLDALNSITSALSQIRTSRLALAHTLTRFNPSSAPSKLKLIDYQPGKWSNFTVGDVIIARVWTDCRGKEAIALEAVGDARGIASWVCGIAVSGLGGDLYKCLKLRKGASKWWVDRETMGEEEVEVVLKEVKEVNEVVMAGVVDGELGDVKRKVEGFGEKMEGLEKDVSCLFTEVMASRNRLLDCHRLLTKDQ